MIEKPKIRPKVSFHDRTIVGRFQNGKLAVGVADFSRTPIVAARPRTRVEFEVGISREEAIAALTAVCEEIEINGLPETVCSIDGKHAKRFDRMLRVLANMAHDYANLSPKAQQRSREHFDLIKKIEDCRSLSFFEEMFRLHKWERVLTL